VSQPARGHKDGNLVVHHQGSSRVAQVMEADAPLHLADGSGEPLDVPPGIGVNEVFLPAISR